MTAENTVALSSLSTWDALCKDCRNAALRSTMSGKPEKKAKDDLRQEKYEYSDVHASRQFERGQSRSDRCPECRKRHKKEIAAFPVAYIDITAIGEATKYVTHQDIGPTGPLGGLGPLPDTHNRRTEFVDLKEFAMGLTDEHIVELLGIMASHQVVVLEAGTGTGKSTLAPFRLMNPPPGAPYRPTDVGPIIVTEPRVPATTEVAQFVGEAMCFGHDAETCFNHVGPGYPVGYQCEGKKVWDEACSLVYVTDGTMVNWITNGDLARIGTVVVDEAHERSENIDLILTLLAAKLPRYPHLRVVIASATIDKTYFMKFFEKTPSVRVGHYHVEAKKQIGYGVPLFSDIDFTEDLLTNGYTAVNTAGEPRFVLPGWPDEPNDKEGGKSLRDLTRDIFLGLRHPASDWPKKQNVVAAAVEQTMKILRATDDGDVLVFMPNRDMVTDVQTKVRLAVDDEMDAVGTVHTYWLMRDTPKNEKKIALASCVAGERKVVVASNLAETSLTIAGIQYVVDAGLVIQVEWDPDLAVAHAPLKAHSQSGIRQRWGRVGRKTHGWVFPLYSLQDYLAMPRDTPAGSTQTNLEGTILKLIAAGEDPTAVVFPADFEADGLNRDSFAQQSANNFRRERGRALTAVQTNGAVSRDGKSLTRLGAELTRSRTSSEKAIALMFADRLACVPEVATVLVALSGKEENERNPGHLAGPGRILAADRKWPIEWNVHARKCHEALAIGCDDDLDLVIRIFAEWKAAPDPSAWCSQWWVNEDALLELAAAAAKLMDSLAPGMSKEAKRPLDPRLAGRARAVLSRALGSLRYSRNDQGKWQSANPNQPDAVIVSSRRLLPAADEVVGLVRARPNDQWAGPVVREGELLGLVSWLAWAAEGEPTDFGLLRRVSLRRDEVQQFRDPASHLRLMYPVGALVRVDSETTGSSAFVKLTDGLAKPPSRADQPSADDDDIDEGDSELIYTSESEALGDPRASRAGAEIPEEEARLIPIPITELETSELEDFTGHDVLSGDSNSDTTVEDPGQTYGAVVRGSVHTPRQWHGIVSGYRVDESGAQLILDPVPAEEERSPQVGETVRAVVVGPVTTHVGEACELRECDEIGAPLLAKPLYMDGVAIDDVRGPDAAALRPGSVWDARFVASRSDYGATRLSVADSVFTRISSNPGATARVRPPAIAACTAVLTGESYRDWRQQVNAIATTDAFGPDLVPEFSIWSDKLEKAGVAFAPGSRIGVEFTANRFARSGKWKPEDIDYLVDKDRDLFERGSKPEFLSSKAAGALSDEALALLLAVDPASAEYETNAWQLWETSRQFGVGRVSALGEAEVSPDAAVTLRRSPNLVSLQRQYSVGVIMGEGGKISVTGASPNVIAALDRIRDAAVQPRASIQLPGRPDGRFPTYPSREQLVAALDMHMSDAKDLSRGYDPRSGQLVLGDAASDLAPLISGHLRQHIGFYSAQLTFADERGFYAFQKKDRWTAIASEANGLERWLIDGGRVWGVFAESQGLLSAGIAAIRAALPRVWFDVSAVEEIVPTVIQLAPITDRFDVSYITPIPPTEIDSRMSETAASLTLEQPRRETSGHSNDEENSDSRTDTSRSSSAIRKFFGRFGDAISRRRIPASILILERDGCSVVDLKNGSYRITDSEGRSQIVLASDFKRDPRPLAWLNEQTGDFV